MIKNERGLDPKRPATGGKQYKQAAKAQHRMDNRDCQDTDGTFATHMVSAFQDSWGLCSLWPSASKVPYSHSATQICRKGLSKGMCGAVPASTACHRYADFALSLASFCEAANLRLSINDKTWDRDGSRFPSESWRSLCLVLPWPLSEHAAG